MKKLIEGIVDFRKNVRDRVKDDFARLALGQAPDVLFIACSDSRVVPNLFASTDPGDLFVVRNVGNLVVPSGPGGVSTADEGEAAAIEFALAVLPVRHIIICGHSECGAMQAILRGRESIGAPNLREWLRHGEPAHEKMPLKSKFATQLAPHNRLSQLNVLAQMEHIRTYPIVRDRLQSKQLMVHGWWFELHGANVYDYDATKDSFVLIDENHAKKIIARLSI